ncbi:hypothetical protein B0T26DRAFT_428964 [Lasiosphaeria miniovina]|uniref:Uncharacterized protein n=1 Tax=Lasiosphaeria miniovina TaxID=1954250 RepID=A0AA40DN83_9PEZI|nr:uncharacterized protein B0T26DRAFT_428964 [Lasiosphaeria miniovina]KAK0709939.1 hypothetical protein B0T26DRAFT_428964 [Lasiosphaeria miniovina]
MVSCNSRGAAIQAKRVKEAEKGVWPRQSNRIQAAQRNGPSKLAGPLFKTLSSSSANGSLFQPCFAIGPMRLAHLSDPAPSQLVLARHRVPAGSGSASGRNGRGIRRRRPAPAKSTRASCRSWAATLWGKMAPPSDSTASAVTRRARWVLAFAVETLRWIQLDDKNRRGLCRRLPDGSLAPQKEPWKAQLHVDLFRRWHGSVFVVVVRAGRHGH